MGCKTDPKLSAVVQQRNRKTHESLLWPMGTKYLPAVIGLTDVWDRATDTFEFLEHVKNGFHGNEALLIFIVRVCEFDPPGAEKPVQWTLLTNKPIHTFKPAWDVVEIYEK